MNKCFKKKRESKSFFISDISNLNIQRDKTKPKTFVHLAKLIMMVNIKFLGETSMHAFGWQEKIKKVFASSSSSSHHWNGFS